MNKCTVRSLYYTYCFVLIRPPLRSEVNMTVELNSSLYVTFNRILAVLNKFINLLVKKQEKYLINLSSTCLK